MRKKFGAKRTIARINNLELKEKENTDLLFSLGIDELISPVQLASEEIQRLIKRSVFTDDHEFEGGKLTVFGISIHEKSALVDKSVQESAYLNPDLTFKPIALHRKEETIIVNAQTVIHSHDIIYFISSPESIDRIIEICGQECFEINNIMILGGSSIGFQTAKLLENDYNVTLVEKNRERSEELASELKDTLVINVDGRNVAALEEEGLADMDAFIACHRRFRIKHHVIPCGD